MLDVDAKIDILLTKWDLVLSRFGERKAQETLQGAKELFSPFEKQVGRLLVREIAARPHYKSALKPAHGLADLLESWVEEPPRKVTPQTKPFPLTRVGSPFDTFALREIPDLFARNSNG
jgi:hypothetical protein